MATKRDYAREYIQRQEHLDEVRTARNARLQAHRDALVRQREWREQQKISAQEAAKATGLAQESYREEMSKRTGMSPLPSLDTSKEADV